jgi:UDP-N-acetylmuramyl tripeptide synthase
MSLLGKEPTDFNALLKDYKPQIGRMEEFDLGKKVILNLAKNPAGFNQAISTVAADKRKKDIIVAVNAEESDGMDVSWLWDVEFEKLNDENLNSICLSGKRMLDLALRFKDSDIKDKKVSENIRNEILSCLNSDAEVVYVLVNYTMLFKTQQILLDIKKEAEGRK